MERISVTVCAGTTCYVMGGAELLALGELMPAGLAPLVELEGAACLGLCRDRASGRAPFALVDGEVLSGLDAAGLLAAVEARAAERGFPSAAAPEGAAAEGDARNPGGPAAAAAPAGAARGEGRPA